MPNVLILGSSGQLGSELKRRFAEKKIPFVTLKRAEFDIASDEPSQKIPAKNLTHIINCTAFHDLPACEKKPELAHATNATGPGKLAAFCNKINATLFHISTDFVFDGEKRTPYTEGDAVGPINVYGESKAGGEKLIRENLAKHFIFRTSHVFGLTPPSGKQYNLIDILYSRARDAGLVQAVNDQTVSPTAAKDIALAVCHFIKNNITDFGTYHCAGLGGTSIFGLAQFIITQMKLSAKVQAVSHTTLNPCIKRPLYSVLDVTKIARHFKMRPWQDMVTDYLREKY